MLANAGFRMAYGIGGLLSPAAMGRLRLAADTPERPRCAALAAAIEAGERSELSDDLVGGSIFSAAGAVTAATSLHAHR
jgi:hypothetical protein